MVGGNRPRHLASQPQIFHGYCQINHDLSAVWGIARINDATFGIEAAFVFLWEVYSREYPPRLCLRDEALAEIDEFPTTRQSLSPFAQFLAFNFFSRVERVSQYLCPPPSRWSKRSVYTYVCTSVERRIPLSSFLPFGETEERRG